MLELQKTINLVEILINGLALWDSENSE